MKKETRKFAEELKKLFEKHGVWMGGVDQAVSFSLNNESIYIRTGWTEDETLIFDVSEYKKVRIE
jgi:hypothetical protein